MKHSLYNININYKSKNYIYNLLTNSIISISKSLQHKIDNKEFELIETSQLNKLIELGFILNDEQSEIELLKYMHNSVKYDNHQRSFIVYPTLKCNLNCSYCFEKVDRKGMNPKQLSVLKDFLIKQAQKNKLTFFHVRWSGGEPLLLWNYINETNEQLREICKKNETKFTTSLCTNGTLIKSEKIAKEIYKSEFEKITISIDGDKQTNDQRRYYKGNRGAYDDIINGVNNLSAFQKVILRVNIDKFNIPHFEDFLKDLDKSLNYKSNTSLYIKPVTAAWGCDYDNSLYKDSDFYEVETSLIQLAIKYNFNVEIHPGFKHHTRCIIYQVGSFLIDPELHLYKCPLHMGTKSERVGYINENSEAIIDNQIASINFTNLSPFDNTECLKCKVLPLCNGKCSEKWKQLNYEENQGCIPEKNTIFEKVKNFIIPNYIDNV